MKNTLKLAPALANKIEEQLDTLTQNLSTMYQQSLTRPQWTRADLSKLQQHVHQYISQIIAFTINREKWVNPLPPSEKSLVFKNLSHYITVRTQIVIQNITGQNSSKDNQQLTNNKINFAKKYFLSWLESLNHLYTHQIAKKEHKRWLRLMAIYEAKKKAEEEARLMNQEVKEPQPQNVPPPALPLWLELPDEDVNAEYFVLFLLNQLGLGIGAGREDIEAAYQEIKTEFEAIPEPTPEEKECFENCEQVYKKLQTIENSVFDKLKILPQQDLDQFINKLQSAVNNLFNTEFTNLESVSNAYNQYAIQNNLDTGSSSSRAQMYKMELIMAKVEYQFKIGNNPLNSARLSQEQETPENHRSLTPQLTIKGIPKH